MVFDFVIPYIRKQFRYEEPKGASGLASRRKKQRKRNISYGE